MYHNFPIAFNQESKAASKEGTWKLSPRVFWTILWEIKFADVTLCTAKPRAEHWPQLILPGSQCCKKLLLVQQCMESPRHLRVGDMLCNLTLDSMQYSWSMIWEAQRSWTNCSSIWRPSEPSASPGSSKKYLRLQNKECCATTIQAQLLIQLQIS